jgi:hypothetical protein
MCTGEKYINRLKSLEIENMGIDEFLQTLRFDEEVIEKKSSIIVENNFINLDTYNWN